MIAHFGVGDVGFVQVPDEVNAWMSGARSERDTSDSIANAKSSPSDAPSGGSVSSW
jgi:hypothetical protein